MPSPSEYLLGALCTVAGGLYIWRWYAQQRAYRKLRDIAGTAIGTVVARVEPGDEATATFTLVIDFQADGSTYRVESHVAPTLAPDPGSELEVLYDPDDPSAVVLPWEQQPSSLFRLALGIVTLLLGASLVSRDLLD